MCKPNCCNPNIFDLTTCDKCKKEILYVRNSGEQRKIYCKDCYSKYFG